MPLKIEKFEVGKIYYRVSSGGPFSLIPYCAILTCLRIGKRDIVFQDNNGNEVRFNHEAELMWSTYYTYEEEQVLSLLKLAIKIIEEPNFTRINKIDPKNLPDKKSAQKILDAAKQLENALAPYKNKR